MRKQCRVENCERVSYEQGYCTLHYRRWLDTGSALPEKKKNEPELTSPTETTKKRRRRYGDPIEHGTENAYGNLGCRCDACRAAGSAANRRTNTRPCKNPECENVAWILGKSGYCHKCYWLFRERPEIPHGTEGRYTQGCRCSLCKIAATESRRQRRKRSALGV